VASGEVVDAADVGDGDPVGLDGLPVAEGLGSGDPVPLSVGDASGDPVADASGDPVGVAAGVSRVGSAESVGLTSGLGARVRSGVRKPDLPKRRAKMMMPPKTTTIAATKSFETGSSM
jgi:hypothetical protein